MSESIRIEEGETLLSSAESVIIIPEIAIKEPGYIQVFTTKDFANAKHEYHAMAQMAYFQFQDEELEIQEVDGPLSITSGEERVSLGSGLLMSRERDGSFLVFIHQFLHKKKLLEATYRYCTRWVRLDI
ncbi:hypothetical protein [Desulforhopalus sp. 52FAK]